MSQSSPSDEAAARRRPPGMYDVARLAGVSQKTVSRVVNNERYVSDEVRERVLRAARELGFRPNVAARALTTGRSQRIGVVSLGTALYGPSSLLMALERATRAAGYSITVANTVEGERDSIAQAANWLLEQGVDGIIISEPIDEGQKVHLDTQVPIVSVGEPHGLSSERVTSLGGINFTASRKATDHLLDLGHDCVWHPAGPQNEWAARERIAGWRTALLDRGIEPPPLIEGDWSPASGYAAGRLLAQNPKVTAVFCANDEMSIGLIRALTEAGRRVPEDISVVGFDDIPTAAYLTPPLTTVHQDFESDAEYVLATLFKHLPEAPVTIPEVKREARPDRRLIIRASTAPPPKAP